MKIVIDPRLCEGNERCANAAPEIFEVRDDKAHLLIERPSAHLLDKIRLAVRMCPRQAISIIDDDAKNN
ncbi:MAG: ferredoxin [Candidatus Binataceae bacterium]